MKPYPFDLPEARSVVTTASSSSPYCENKLRSDSVVVSLFKEVTRGLVRFFRMRAPWLQGSVGHLCYARLHYVKPVSCSVSTTILDFYVSSSHHERPLTKIFLALTSSPDPPATPPIMPAAP